MSRESDPHGASRALQEEATDLRIRADALRGEARALDLEAMKLEARLGRLGLRSFYAGSRHRDEQHNPLGERYK